MKEQLIIRSKVERLNPDSEVEWFLYADNNLLLSGRSVLNSLAATVAEHSERYQCVLLIPAHTCLLTEVEVPAKQPRQVVQALPFVVEERIAEDIEAVHVAIEQPVIGSHSSYAVAVIQHNLLIHTLDSLSVSGLSASAVYPDVLQLPYVDNVLSVVIDEQCLLLRWKNYAVASIDVGHLELLKHYLQQATAVSHSVQLIYSAQSKQQSLIEQLKTELADSEFKEVCYQESISELLAHQTVTANLSRINLLQGGYRVSEQGEGLTPRLKQLMYATAASVSIFVLVALGTGWYFDSRADSREDQIYALYREIFPAERRVISPKKQMQSHLANAGPAAGQANFMQLLTGVASQWSLSEQAPQLNLLRYSVAKDQLQLELKVSSVTELAQFKDRLSQQGMKVEINSANEHEKFVLGRISVGLM
jgi:general secretion pathway protein L